MKLTFDKRPPSTVRDAVNNHCQFIFDNHVYCIVNKKHCKDCRIVSDWDMDEMAVCFNVKSHTFRCLSLDAEVKLVDCTVDVRERKSFGQPSNMELAS